MSPITLFLCDLIDVQERRITKQEMRKRWQAGKYLGVKPDYAKWAMEAVR